MARGPAFSDNVTHTYGNKTSPTAAISDEVTSSKTEIEYNTLVKLVSQEIPDADSNLLKNAIHPIFQKENWQESAHGIWPQLQPALRLASKFIGEDEMLAFWYHLVWGRRKMQDVSDKFGYQLERFSAEGPPLNAIQKQQISRWLRDFGEKRLRGALVFKAGMTLGKTTRTRAGAIIVDLTWELFEILSNHGSGRKLLSETQLLRINFLIATILLHELGHAVHQSLRCSKYEPYYGNHAVAEVGHAWSCWAFGGAIARISMPTNEASDFVGGFWVATPPSPWQMSLVTEAWPATRPPPPLLGDLPKVATCWILATAYVQKVQTEKFWSNEIKAHGVEALHVPPAEDKDGDQRGWDGNWTASVRMRRGAMDEMMVEGCSFRAGVGYQGRGS